MKKFLRISAVLFALITISVNVSAESPYNTWAWGPGYPVRTQDAYTPIGEFTLPVSAPEDMYVAPDGYMYLADTGDGRILKLKDFEIVTSIGEGILENPTGIFVDDQGTMYVADSKKNEVFIFDRDGNLLTRFGRPGEPLFGIDAEFLPRKIEVDARKNLYIVSEGSVNGLVQMNMDGNFIGYFASNQATMSFKMILQRLFLSKEQLAQFIKNTAASPSNLFIDDQGLVYTITAGTTRHKSIRKFTVSGKNIFPDTYDALNFRDINVSSDGLVIAVDAEGEVFEYDSMGMLLFYFDAHDYGEQRLGTLQNPTAIGRYQDFIYILDKDKNAIVAYQTTTFSRTVHEGVSLYTDGYYSEAKPYFEDVLNRNGSFILAYQAIGDAYFKEQSYPAALEYYRYGIDRTGYSEAFWELRNLFLQNWLGTGILGLTGFLIIMGILSRLDRRFGWFNPARNWFGNLTRFKLIDDFVFLFRFIKQPVDSFYYIKKNLRGSLLFAAVIYVWVVIARVVSLYITGFIFNKYESLSRIHVENEVTLVVLLIVIWNTANYLVSTISDGEGRIRDVVIGSAYSLFPYALLVLPIALVSNVLTLNEVFIYSFSTQIMYFWMALMLFLMVKEIHNYSFWETIRNILITLFTMALFVLTGYILYVLFNQLFNFISALIQEFGLRG
jgi:tetratricopeptide (TPR) repeat protein